MRDPEACGEQMNLWTNRDSALQVLWTDMIRERELLDKAFQQLEYFAQRLGHIRPATSFTKMAALIAAKARNLAQACYSLSLDGLGQESGAIVRVWIEATELLVYLRCDPDRADKKLPSAGERAKAIGSSMQGLRTYLSKTASHVGLEGDSWLYMQVETRREFKRDVLRENLGTTFALLFSTIKEAALCLKTARGSVEEGIVRQMDQLRREGIILFNAGLDMSMPNGN